MLTTANDLNFTGAADRSCAIGLDVGGTKIAAALVSPEGKVLAKETIPTGPARGGEAVLADAVGLAQSLAVQARRSKLSVDGIGVGVCELVNLQGQVISAHTIDWRGVPVQERFESLAPALIEADSRAAAFAEAQCGAGKRFESFYYVTIGTGIGGSWISQGVPYAGATGCTGTLASSPVSILCPDCQRVQRSVVEEVASGPALVARYNRRAKAAVGTAEEVVAAAALGDVEAESVIATAVECLGSSLGLIVNLLDPQALVVGGGLGAASGLYWNRLAPTVRAHIWSDIHRELPIVQAACGGDSGVIGAALLALRRVGST